MTIRFLIALALAFSTSAFAGDPPYQGPNLPPLPPPHGPAPTDGFCDGLYDGYLYNQGPLTLEVRENGACGQVVVRAFWGGMTFEGPGVCGQVAPCQAVLDFQFPGSAPQRGIVNGDRRGPAVMNGQVFGGDAFHLVRH